MYELPVAVAMVPKAGLNVSVLEFLLIPLDLLSSLSSYSLTQVSEFSIEK